MKNFDGWDPLLAERVETERLKTNVVTEKPDQPPSSSKQGVGSNHVGLQRCPRPQSVRR
jgi:hypothetical protein